MKALKFPLLPGLLIICLSALISCQKTTVPPLQPPVVDAGPSQTIKLPVDSVKLIGTVTFSSSRIVGYLWSEVSGPNVPLMASEGSRTTMVSGLIAGTYIFQMEATDSLGLTGLDTVTVMVYNREPVTVTLTTGSGPKPYEMWYLGNPSADQSSANAPELDALTWTINGSVFFGRSAFRFDMSSLVGINSIKSAKLTLYSNPTPLNGDLVHANYGSSNAFYIQRIVGSWNPATATWATQPSSDTTGQVSVPQTNQNLLDLVDVDVTNLVNSMLLLGNNGFMIRLQNETVYNSRIFCSSTYSDTTKHPKLVINY